MSEALKLLNELPQEGRNKVIELVAHRLLLDEMQRRAQARLGSCQQEKLETDASQGDSDKR